MMNEAAPPPASDGTSALDAQRGDHDDVTADQPTELDHGDGRTRRRQRNRNAVISALIALIQEGDLDPTVAKIADRAGVSHRSIFRYFEDLDDLANTAVETESRNVWPESVVPDVGVGSLEHRIEQLINAHMRTFQRTHSLGRVARAKAISIPEIDRGLAAVNDARTNQLRRQFEPELQKLDQSEAQAVVIAASVLVSFEAFDVQRRSFNLSIDEVREVWRQGLRSLLAEHA